MISSFKTIKGLATGEFRDRGSKFIGYAIPISSEEDIKARVAEIKTEHPKAGHHCFAFRLDVEKKVYRANDDGEPSGTAGKPILGQIDSKGLSKVIVIVVRYWGGTKLGVPGLINAYRTAAQEALSNADIVEQEIEAYFKLSFQYELMNEVMRMVKADKWKIRDQLYEECNILIVSIRVNKKENAESKMEQLHGLKYELLHIR